MKCAIILAAAVAAMASALPSGNKPLLPWVSDEERFLPHECGPFGYDEKTCGTLIYCDAFESAIFNKPTGYANTQQCLDAHEPAPILPWVAAPNVFRPSSCQVGLISAECPFVCGLFGTFNDKLCGTKRYCEAFDKVKPKPLGYKNTEECFRAHRAL
ncbi:hypothetical protein CDD82_7762 [Ophiocordyceps australis]|uniref:Chitin-binding type-2 domain-containing protein n=1 Tax=Ophiocordyceps australis TaxID=1399860 RepID=A0A2C5YUQ2_9HYPO|nr:hypothetical protein CDD82_7762 [Ophiocordyceps australis]